MFEAARRVAWHRGWKTPDELMTAKHIERHQRTCPTSSAQLDRCSWEMVPLAGDKQCSSINALSANRPRTKPIDIIAVFWMRPALL